MTPHPIAAAWPTNVAILTFHQRSSQDAQWLQGKGVLRDDWKEILGIIYDAKIGQELTFGQQAAAVLLPVFGWAYLAHKVRKRKKAVLAALQHISTGPLKGKGVGIRLEEAWALRRHGPNMDLEKLWCAVFADAPSAE